MMVEFVKATFVGMFVLFILALAATISLAATTFVLFFIFAVLVGHALIEEFRLIRR